MFLDRTSTLKSSNTTISSEFLGNILRGSFKPLMNRSGQTSGGLYTLETKSFLHLTRFISIQQVSISPLDRSGRCVYGMPSRTNMAVPPPRLSLRTCIARETNFRVRDRRIQP